MTKLLNLLDDGCGDRYMIEVVGTIAEVEEKLRGSPDGTLVIGPTVDRRWGITSCLGGVCAHLEVANVREGREGITRAEGVLYVSPIPQDRSLLELIDERLSNCAVIQLPEYSVSSDLFGRDQAMFEVDVVMSESGETPQDWHRKTFAITPRRYPRLLTGLAA